MLWHLQQQPVKHVQLLKASLTHWVEGNKKFMLMKQQGPPHCSGLLSYKSLSYKILRFILQDKFICWPFYKTEQNEVKEA